MRSITRLALVLLLALAGALAACGDDDGGTDVGLQDRDLGDRDDDSDDGDDDADDAPDDDSDDDSDADDDSDDDDTDDDGELPAEAGPYVDALTATFADDEALPIPGDQARCIATNIVAIVRVERLAGAGISPEEFAGDDVELSGLGLELDEGLAIMDAFGECDYDFYQELIVSSAAEAADPAAARACMEAAVTPEQLRQFMARAFVEGDAFEDSPDSDAVFGAIFACSFGDTGTGG